MFSKSRLTLVITIATLAFAVPAGTAMAQDLRGEHAASQSQVAPAPSGGGPTDLRSPDSVTPFDRAVVVEVGGQPVSSSGIDWSAVLVGFSAGAALVLLAAAGVAGTRRRHARPTIV